MLHPKKIVEAPETSQEKIGSSAGQSLRTMFVGADKFPDIVAGGFQAG